MLHWSQELWWKNCEMILWIQWFSKPSVFTPSGKSSSYDCEVTAQDLNFRLQHVKPLNQTLPSSKHLLNPSWFLTGLNISHMGKPKMPVPGRRPGKQQVIEFSKSKMPDLHPSPDDHQRRSFKDVKRTAILAGLRAMKAPTVSRRHFVVYGLEARTCKIKHHIME